MKASATPISDLDPATLVAKFGLSRSYAFELVKRNKVPSLDLAVQIEREFGVPAKAWMDRAAEQRGAAA